MRGDTRRRIRQIVVEALYESENSSHDAAAVVTRRLAEVAEEDPDLRESRSARVALQMLEGVRATMEDADALITHSAPRYPLETMAVVDRNILRLAIWELLTDASAPEAAVVNEAVELAHRYSGGSSPSFINGVLRTISQNIRGNRDEAVQDVATGESADPSPEES